MRSGQSHARVGRQYQCQHLKSMMLCVRPPRVLFERHASWPQTLGVTKLRLWSGGKPTAPESFHPMDLPIIWHMKPEHGDDGKWVDRGVARRHFLHNPKFIHMGEVPGINIRKLDNAPDQSARTPPKVCYDRIAEPIQQVRSLAPARQHRSCSSGSCCNTFGSATSNDTIPHGHRVRVRPYL